MILLIFFAMNNAGLVLVIYFNVLLRKTQVSLCRISTSFQKKMQNSSCYLFCIKMTKSKYLNFQSKINKFSRLLFSILSHKLNPLVNFFSCNGQCQIVFGTKILRLFVKVLFLLDCNLRVNSPFRSRNSLIWFFPTFTMLCYV